MKDDDKYTVYCIGPDRRVEKKWDGLQTSDATRAMMLWLANGGHNAVIENEKTGVMLMPELVFKRLDGPMFGKNKVVID